MPLFNDWFWPWSMTDSPFVHAFEFCFRLYAHGFICVLFYLSIYLSVCLHICLSICLPIYLYFLNWVCYSKRSLPVSLLQENQRISLIYVKSKRRGGSSHRPTVKEKTHRDWKHLRFPRTEMRNGDTQEARERTPQLEGKKTLARPRLQGRCDSRQEVRCPRVLLFLLCYWFHSPSDTNVPCLVQEMFTWW